MFGGKPVTVQMPGGGGNKTLTFVQPQQGKILRLPVGSTVTQASSDQPKLMVVKPKPSATIGKSHLRKNKKRAS